MNKLNLKGKMSKGILAVKKASPELLVAAGVVGVVASTVLACKATKKIDAILDDSKGQLEQIKKLKDNPELVPADMEYTEEDANKDMTIVYAKTAVQVAKEYAPAVILGVVSIASIVQSHRILSKRNAGLAAAYAAVDRGFKEYRGRVIDRFGADLDNELRYDIKAKEIEEIIVNEDGTETVEKKIVNVANPNAISDFARFFDDGCIGWTKDPEHNYLVVRQMERFMNDKLRADKFLFLNDVYKAFGFPRTVAGQSLGWEYNNGEGYVDFGIFSKNDEAKRNFVNGYERTILLDFNVQGNILKGRKTQDAI